ncbi:MAG TPA: peptidylprolyl isomerase [Xanthobacteraceae bacterium]|nr:peptidylprolyl isomerase [Xanthobacteraceae bacterium]
MTATNTAVSAATINDVRVETGAWPSLEVAAVQELLRQRAVERGFLPDGTSDAQEIALAIERLLADEVRVPSPGEAECRRYYDGHPQEFQSGDIVHVRHILFQVTPSVPIPLLRAKAEETLNELLREPDRFDALARELSNCPSGQQGGNLGQISRGDTVPEFEQVLFRLEPTGILRELVKTRFGFHIVAVDRRIPGRAVPFEAVRDRIAERLKTMVEEKALRQYVSVLAGQAEITGVDLQAAETPLVQ